MNAEAFRSAHLGRPHWAQVRVNPEAMSTYLSAGPDSTFAPGTLIVEWLRDERAGNTGPVLALERRADAWYFWELRPNGSVGSGPDLAPCAGCHAAAPAAPVFGIPRLP